MYADRPNYVDSPSIFDAYGPHIQEGNELGISSRFRLLYEQAVDHFLARLAHYLDRDETLFVPTSMEEVPSKMRVVSDCINQTWVEIGPAAEQMKKYIEADPTLTHPSEWTAANYDVDYMTPEQIAKVQLEQWVTASLHEFWQNRFEGKRTVVCKVGTKSVQVDRVLPPSTAKTIYQ